MTSGVLGVLGIVLSLFVVSPCYSADLLLIQGSRPDTSQDIQIRALADFYGLRPRVVNIDSVEGMARAVAFIKSPATVAIAFREDVLSTLFRSNALWVLKERSTRLPMLAFGITTDVDQAALRFWSGGTVRSCTAIGVPTRPTIMAVAKSDRLSRQLTGMELPAMASPICKMQLGHDSSVHAVLTVRDGQASAPLLVRVQSTSREMFVVPQETLLESSCGVNSKDSIGTFASMAPFIFFVSYVAGEYAWHLDGHYANFTIDDPWLTQPYGNLDYEGLLAEMDRHTFHTTIAFIPWNFDRSEKRVVSLFRKRPDRFSICMHGNNHSHQEFGDYQRNPLTRQIADIKQGVARMERFHSLTSIPYDRFMVFPHAVAPEETFELLTAYGFSGTANSSNVPMSSDPPDDLGSLFRPSASVYGGLLSLSRHPVLGEIPRLQLAIESFFGNPLLFYSHENLFEGGARAFDHLADFVNQLQSDVKWTSLGEIARHSHLIRRRFDGNVDVLMFSSEMDLVNPDQEEREFFVTKVGQSLVANSVTVNGSPVAFKRTGDIYRLSLSIPAHQVCKVRLLYENDLDLVREDVRKTDLYSYSLRIASDFRDLHLSRSRCGSALIRGYYLHQWDKVEFYLEEMWWLGIALLALLLVGLWRLRLLGRVRMALKRDPGSQ
jgi:hypothetical protein